MNKTALLLSALMSLAFVSEAAAWSRNRTVTTQHGSSQFSASGSCAGGVCSRSAVRTGPQGNSLSANTTVTCDASRQNCSRTKVYSGSNGGSATVTGSVSR
jgi:hypothetical protein